MEYHDVIYSHYKVSDYDAKLVRYLLCKYFRVPGSKLLDVGCGSGKYVNLFKEYIGAEGIDNEIDFDTNPLPYKKNSFDYIFSKSVIEHLANTDFFLSEIYRILKPGGVVVFLTPAWEYNMKWFYDDPTHIKPFHRKGLQDALRLSDFKSVEVDYFYHLPQTWHHSWFKYIATLVRNFTPDRLRWKDKEEQQMNVFIRFCKEVQLLGTGVKEK